MGVARGPEQRDERYKSDRREVCETWSISSLLTLERNRVLFDADDALVGDNLLAILNHGRDVDLLPLDGHVGRSVDFLDTV